MILIHILILKSAVEKLKNSGVEYIFIDEISMVNSKIWGVLSDIKKKYNFKFDLNSIIGRFALAVSLNLAFPAVADPKWINQVHMEAWKQGVKTLYYMRTESVLRGDIAAQAMNPDCVSCEG